MSDALKEQLKELNNRARWYSGQLWYIPFAYFGLVAITIGNVVSKQAEHLGFALFVCGAIGLFVLWHMWQIKDGEKRAVENLQQVEADLQLKPTVQYKGYSRPFFFGVVTVTISTLVGAVFLLCSCSCG